MGDQKTGVSHLCYLESRVSACFSIRWVISPLGCKVAKEEPSKEINNILLTSNQRNKDYDGKYPFL
jgi:hypothetical protein